MRKLMTALAIAGLFVGGWLLARSTTEAGGKGGPMLAHMVYFTLKDRSSAAVQRMVETCQKYLPGHPGVIFFAAGYWEIGLGVLGLGILAYFWGERERRPRSLRSLSL